MRNILIRLLVCSIVAPISTAALAQSDDETAEGVLEEIIVTSDRRERAVMDVPQSIQAVTEAQLQLPTLNDLSDIQNLVPGATTFSNKAPNKEGIQFRGSGIVQSGASDGQAPVGYYVDDVPYVDISTPVPPPIGTFDLQRIEILRGPQGTSYGQDSSAGSVILRTNPVDLQNFGYKVRAGFSKVEGTKDNGYMIGGVLNLPIAEDVFGIRLSYFREEDSGYGVVSGQPEYDDPLANTRDTLRVKALWDVTEWLDLELTHSEWNTSYNILPGTQILDSTGGGMLLNPVSTAMLLDLFPDGQIENDYEIKWTTLLAVFDLGFAELTSSTGFVDTPKKETISEFIFDIGLGPQESAVVFNQPAETFTQELRLVSTNDSPLQWLAGFFYMDAESNSSGFTDTPDFFFREAISDPIEAEAWAVYGEIEYQFNDQWSAKVGVRHHDEDRTNTSDYQSTSFFPDFTYFSDPLFGPYTDVIPTTVEKNSFDHTSYRIGVTWTPSENGMVYLMHSTANRAPIILGPNDRMALENAGFNPSSNIDPAELVNTELGTKWTLADGMFQLEAAYVYGDWNDLPMWADVNIPPMPIAMPIGGTDGLVETWELALNWAITDSFRMNYALAVTETEVKKVPPEGSVDGYPGAVRKGGDLFNYSPTTHNFGLSYAQAVSANWDLYSSLNYVTRDKPDGLNVFTAPTDYVPAADKYENLGFNIGMVRGPWDFTFSITNLTDHDGQYLPRTALGGGDAQLFGLIQQPRTYTIQVSYDGMMQ
ncbi:MAG: TonB-dependent receptor [Gammaproteobacteria bacterium]